MRTEHIAEMYFNSLRFSILYFSQLKNVILIIFTCKVDQYRHYNLFYAIINK